MPLPQKHHVTNTQLTHPANQNNLQPFKIDLQHLAFPIHNSYIPTVDASEIPNNHLGCLKPYKQWDNLWTGDSRISGCHQLDRTNINQCVLPLVNQERWNPWPLQPTTNPHLEDVWEDGWVTFSVNQISTLPWLSSEPGTPTTQDVGAKGMAKDGVSLGWRGVIENPKQNAMIVHETKVETKQTGNSRTTFFQRFHFWLSKGSFTPS